MKGLHRSAVLVLLLGTRSVHASMFGEENLQLGTLVTQGITQAKKVRETLEYVRQTTEFARDTAFFAQQAVQVERNMEALVANPARLFAHSTQAWRKSFPELQDILEHTYDIRQSMEAIQRPQDMPLYDPYAYVRAFDSMHTMQHSGFEALAHAVDRWGVNDPHDESIQALKSYHDIADKNLTRLAEVINTTGLSPVQASIYTAQATSASAAAQVQAAATLEHISRNMELMITGQAAQESEEDALLNVQAAGAVNMHLKSWRLEPGAPHPTGER
jgi:hypothetical protein